MKEYSQCDLSGERGGDYNYCIKKRPRPTAHKIN